MAVRSSKYRHVYGDPTRKDKCIDNIRLTKNAFDANLVKSNGKYVSLNWEASGGGSFAVVPVSEQGKLPDRFPLFDGHRGPVLDTDWNPFDDEVVVSASDDGTIGVWRVPENYSVHVDYGSNLDDCPDVKPVKFISGHGKKVGHVGFNPIAKDVLASSSLDNTVKVWNIETDKLLFNLKHPSFVTSFSWNYDGTKLATTAKDRILRVWDVRNEKIISEGKGHAGAKGSRVIWLGDNDRVLTTGFSLVSDREMALWDINDIPKGPIGGFRGLDPSSGIVIPHYDPMTSMVYLGGRGDGKIVYYEYADDTLYDLFAFNSTSPQRGLGWAPNRSLKPGDHEVARVYKVHESLIEPISFKVPLKSEGFLDSVYTEVEAAEPSLTADEWASGKTARPLVKHWRDVYDGKPANASEAKPKAEVKTEPKTESKSEPKTESKSESKAEPKSESKAEPKSESKAEPKSEPKSESKAEPKTESKAEPKTESKTKSKSEPKLKTETLEFKTDEKANVKTFTASKSEVSALNKAEKQDSYDVLHSDNVKSFLAKNSQQEPDSESEPESDWNEKSDAISEPKSQSNGVPKEVKSVKIEPKTESKEVPKDEPKEDAKPSTKNVLNGESKSAKSVLKDEPESETTPSKTKVTKSEPAPTKSEPTKNAATKNTVTEVQVDPSISPVKVVVSDNTSSEDKFDLILKKLDDLSARIEKLEARHK